MVPGGLRTTLDNLSLLLPGLPLLPLQRMREERELRFPEPPVRWLRVSTLHGGRAETESEPLSLEISSSWVRVRSPGSILPAVLVEEVKGQTETRTGVDGEGRLLLSAPPLPLRVGRWADPRRRGIEGWAFELPLEEHEHLYGLGERFTTWDFRGQSHVLWSVDTLADSTGPRSYKPVPLLLSCRGHALFLHSTSRSLWSATGDRLRVFVEGPLDLFVLRGPTPAQALAAYTALTGRPSVPPRWSFGLWLSRCMYPNRAEVERVVEEARRRKISVGVVSLDPLWLRGRRGLPRDAFTGEWSERRFPDPPGLAAWLAERGVRLCLWMNPYLPKRFPIYREARERGLLPTRRGRPAASMDNPFAVPVDVTKPEARAWLGGWLERLLRSGAAVFKTDYGEEAPPWGEFSAGNGRAVHNLYPLLYNRAVFEAVERVHGRGMVWARSGWAGSQRYPVHWSGDTKCRWLDLPHLLRGGLNAAVSGIAHWSHDIGGFFGTPSEELYIRWAQFGLFVSHARCHGTTPREPWLYGERALAVFRHHLALRDRLVPYLYSCAHIASRSGLPVLRPMVLEFPGDPETHELDTQYMLGPSLLVAPVLEEGATTKRVYFPAGRWTDWWSGEVWRGPGRFEVPAPLERLPLFVREGTLLPLAPEGTPAGTEPDQLTLAAFPDGDGNARLTLLDDGGESTVALHRRDGVLTVVASTGARDRTFEVRLPGAGILLPIETEGVEGVGHGAEGGAVWLRFGVKVGRGVRIRAELGPG